MSTRRKFLINTVIGTTSIAASCKAAASGKPLVNKPIVLSTWDFGFPANAEAWKTLDKGGRALDAVEAGVKVPEGKFKQLVTEASPTATATLHSMPASWMINTIAVP